MKNTMKNTINDNNNLKLTIEEKAWILSMRKITPAMRTALTKYPTLDEFLKEVGISKKIRLRQMEHVHEYAVAIREGTVYELAVGSEARHLPIIDLEGDVKGLFGTNLTLHLKLSICNGRVIHAQIREVSSGLFADNVSYGQRTEYAPNVAETLRREIKEKLNSAMKRMEESIQRDRKCIKNSKKGLVWLRELKETLK
jgi:hypothetical protein